MVTFNTLLSLWYLLAITTNIYGESKLVQPSVHYPEHHKQKAYFQLEQHLQQQEHTQKEKAEDWCPDLDYVLSWYCILHPQSGCCQCESATSDKLEIRGKEKLRPILEGQNTIHDEETAELEETIILEEPTQESKDKTTVIASDNPKWHSEEQKATSTELKTKIEEPLVTCHCKQLTEAAEEPVSYMEQTIQNPEEESVTTEEATITQEETSIYEDSTAEKSTATKKEQVVLEETTSEELEALSTEQKTTQEDLTTTPEQSTVSKEQTTMSQIIDKEPSHIIVKLTTTVEGLTMVTTREPLTTDEPTIISHEQTSTPQELAKQEKHRARLQETKPLAEAIIAPEKRIGTPEDTATFEELTTIPEDLIHNSKEQSATPLHTNDKPATIHVESSRTEEPTKSIKIFKHCKKITTIPDKPKNILNSEDSSIIQEDPKSARTFQGQKFIPEALITTSKESTTIPDELALTPQALIARSEVITTKPDLEVITEEIVSLREEQKTISEETTATPEKPTPEPFTAASEESKLTSENIYDDTIRELTGPSEVSTTSLEKPKAKSEEPTIKPEETKRKAEELTLKITVMKNCLQHEKTGKQHQKKNTPTEEPVSTIEGFVEISKESSTPPEEPNTTPDEPTFKTGEFIASEKPTAPEELRAAAKEISTAPGMPASTNEGLTKLSKHSITIPEEQTKTTEDSEESTELPEEPMVTSEERKPTPGEQAKSAESTTTSQQLKVTSKEPKPKKLKH